MAHTESEIRQAAHNVVDRMLDGVLENAKRTGQFEKFDASFSLATRLLLRLCQKLHDLSLSDRRITS